MPTYSKVVSTLRQIDTIHTFIGGTRTDIDSAWVFVNGERKQVFPSAEQYTQVYEKTTGGAFSETLPYGKYKIVISGGGGAGAAVGRATSDNPKIQYNQDGFAGEEITVYLDVLYDETKTVSGTIGTGAAGSYVKPNDYNPTSSVGAVGTGYANGTAGQHQAERYSHNQSYATWAIASGSAGGSSSLYIDGNLNSIAKGGNGGSCQLRYGSNKTCNGGVGGSGGTTSGTGAAGGGHIQLWNNAGTSGAGSTGYIHIYKSSIFPN